jgi:predicted PhzF superfamily epimerase YddE/YHI9
MSLRHGLFCVDAFADRIGTGNPAGVCLLREPADPPGCRQLPGR